MEDNACIIDSSVLVAFYDQGDIQHGDAVSIIKEIEGKIIFIHQYVVQEVTTVLCYRFGSTIAKKFLENIANAENVVIPWIDTKEEMAFFAHVNKKISFTDTSLILLSKKKNLPLLTFDKQIISLLRNMK